MKITISPYGKDYYISNNYYNDDEKAISDYINFVRKNHKKGNCLICLIKDKKIIDKAVCHLNLSDIYFL